MSELDCGSSQHGLPGTAQATLSRQKSADQAELQAAESLADLDRVLLESLSKSDPAGQSLGAASASGIPSESTSVRVSGAPQPNQPVTTTEDKPSAADELSVQGCSGTSAEAAVSELNQSSEEAAVSPGNLGGGSPRVAESNQSDEGVKPSSQSKLSTSSAGDEPPSPASAVAASTRDQSSQVTSGTQSGGGSPPGPSEQGVPASGEGDAGCEPEGVPKKEEETRAATTRDRAGRSAGKMADDVQVRFFAVVSVSNFFVHFVFYLLF